MRSLQYPDHHTFIKECVKGMSDKLHLICAMYRYFVLRFIGKYKLLQIKKTHIYSGITYIPTQNIQTYSMCNRVN